MAYSNGSGGTIAINGILTTPYTNRLGQAQFNNAYQYSNRPGNSTTPATVTLASGLSSTNNQMFVTLITNPSGDMWTATPPAGSLTVYGVFLAAGDNGLTPPQWPKTMITFCDSTGLGTGTFRNPSSLTSQADDSMRTIANYISTCWGVEDGRVSIYSNGYVATNGTNNAPVLGSACGYQWAGVPRINTSTGALLQHCDIILEMKGNSDFTAGGVSAASLQAAAIAAWPTLVALAPNAIFIKLVPCSNGFLSNWLAAFSTVFGTYSAVCTTGKATLYKAAASNAYLVDFGTDMASGLQNNGGSSVSGFDTIHPDDSQHGRMGAILGYFGAFIFGGAGTGTAYIPRPIQIGY